MKYKLRKLHAGRNPVEVYAEGEADAIYVRSHDVSWITVRKGVLIITTDEEHWARPQVVVDIMREKPDECPEGQPSSNVKKKKEG